VNRWRFAVCGLVLVLCRALPAEAQIQGNGEIVPGKHRGPVTAMVHRGDVVLSAGEDGFLEIWNVQNAAAAGRFQLTSYRIIAMAARPGKEEICLVESDGLGLYRISAWNYREQSNIFTLRFRDPIGFIGYSMGGNFIIAARTGRTGLVFIGAASGDVLKSPDSLTGTVQYAATGRSERNMAVYLASGTLSYWDLESGNETNRFDVPYNLHSPILFGNNRYLAGVNADGLAVIDAASGNQIAENSAIPPDSLLCAAGDDFFCLAQTEESAEIRRFTVDRNGRLSGKGYFLVQSTAGGRAGKISTIAASADGAVVLGTADGAALLLVQDGQVRPMAAKDQTGIVETAVSGQTIAFLAENNSMGFVPLDYNLFTAGETIRIERLESYSRVSAIGNGAAGPQRFLFWQDKNTAALPVIRSPDSTIPPLALNGISFRFPIRSVSTTENGILFLDSAGNLSALAPFDAGKSRPFTFFSIGILDAAFIDRDNVIIGRSAVSGNSPFLIINIATGETVPLPHPSQAGVMVYRGTSGGIYTAVVDQDETGPKTSILQFNTANPGASVRLIEFQGEDTQFSIAESQGHLAATIGGEGAAIYSAGETRRFERTPGLPLRLIDGGRFFISLDTDGNICWHDNRTGKLLAMFRLYRYEWVLQTGAEIISGYVAGAY
jgi:hypothetical protein